MLASWQLSIHSIHCRHRGCAEVFVEPPLQRHIFFRRRVAAIVLDRITEQLAPDWTEVFVQMLHHHVVFGAYPAIAVAIKQYLAGQGGVIGTARMPQAAIENYGRPCIAADRYGGFG